jgi:hypothetical protein
MINKIFKKLLPIQTTEAEKPMHAGEIYYLWEGLTSTYKLIGILELNLMNTEDAQLQTYLKGLATATFLLHIKKLENALKSEGFTVPPRPSSKTLQGGPGTGQEVKLTDKEIIKNIVGFGQVYIMFYSRAVMACTRESIRNIFLDLMGDYIKVYKYLIGFGKKRNLFVPPPPANPDSGKVSPGAMIALSNANMDDDKIHYTTDGSTPTLNSPIYNWIAKRWWSARGDVLGTINCPVGPINKTTTIKAITIGPGKYDSDVATFTYEVSGDISEVGDGTEAPGAEEQEKEEQKQEEPVTLNDITGHWALDSINTLVRQGCISGYPDGSFKPENTITRAEFAAVLVKAFQLENNDGKIFSDTAAHWAKDYIAAAAAKGLVSGYAGGNFGPDDLITREQMAVMIVKAAGLAPAAEAPGFADSAAISGWAVEAVAAATENGIMKGYSDNTIRPGGSATRAEAVTVIMNALNKMNTLNN